MKKILPLVLIMLLIVSFSAAESLEINIEGEWYVAALYTERCRPTAPDEYGSFRISLDEEPIQEIHVDGQLYDDGEYRGTLVHYSISDNAQLYYLLEDSGSFSGYLFISDENGWKYYYLANTGKYLLYDGKMLPAPNSTGDKSEYYQSGGSMFLIKDDSYVKGTIIPYGNKAFAFVMDVDPIEHDYGNGLVVSWGYPMYFFINTDLK